MGDSLAMKFGSKDEKQIMPAMDDDPSTASEDPKASLPAPKEVA